MAKTRKQKEQEVKKLGADLKSSKSVVFTTFDKLTVEDSEALRNSLRNEKVSYQVSKKTLLRRALADSKIEDINVNELKNNIGIATSEEDEVAAAKVLANFAKNHEQLIIKGGFLESKFISAEKIKELAKLPSKLELIAKTLGTIKAPITGLVNVLAGNLRCLVNVLNAIKGNK